MEEKKSDAQKQQQQNYQLRATWRELATARVFKLHLISGLQLAIIFIIIFIIC